MQSQQPAGAARISAVLDGEAPDELDALCASLGDEERAAWSVYHLIGDALRSDDLADVPGAGAPFMRRLSARLVDEPHLLAPSPSFPSSQHARAWPRRAAPVFGAAAVAAMLTWVLVPQWRHLGESGTSVRVASQQNAGGLRQPASPSAAVNAGSLREVDMVRDVRLDQYLEAHQQFAPRPAMEGTPYLRAAVTAEGR